jgi:hypothetical protein
MLFIFRAGNSGKMGQKDVILPKRTGELIENKGSAPQNGTKRTEKRTGEVLQNQHLWKKPSGPNRKTKRAILLKTFKSKNQETASRQLEM